MFANFNIFDFLCRSMFFCVYEEFVVFKIVVDSSLFLLN